MAREYRVRLLGELPLDAHIHEEADGGRPTVVAAPDSPRARPYFAMARRGCYAERAGDDVRNSNPTIGGTTMRCLRLAICCGVLALTSCANPTPKTTGGLGNLPLEPSQYPGTLVYRAPDLQAGKYKSIFVDKADIYRAADADFGGASEEDKARMAEKLSTDFKNALTKHHYTLVSQSGPSVVRLHLILAGIKESKPVAATALRLTPLGLGMSAAKTVTGHDSSALVGSVTVSGELIDAESGEALAGFVATESPIALDLTSGMGKLRAAELGIERGSEEFAVALDRYLHRTPAPG